jgi:hypothetical protein
MKFSRSMRMLSAVFLLAFTIPVFAQVVAPAQAETILHSADLTKIVPDAVFFRGQSATTQERNSGGVRFADGYVMFAVLVDTSGYSTGVQQKYQAYFVTEVPLMVGGRRLAPGAYGAGMVKSGAEAQFVVQDIGAHDLFTVAAAHDAKLHRPTPLQVLAGAGAGVYRLYLGRDYVEFSRAQ